MMELRELTKKTLEIFGVDDVGNLGTALMDCVTNDDHQKMTEFMEAVNGELDVDHLQMIYQYWLADRKNKKQDYTPACLAKFLSKLIEDSTQVIDLCAGSGALTIQRWNELPDTAFELYEIDENVIPYLLFNLCIRNITATVYQGDVLGDDSAVCAAAASIHEL